LNSSNYNQKLKALSCLTTSIKEFQKW